MCYSAQIRQDFDRFVREYGASIDIATFVRLYWDRREGAKVKNELQINPPTDCSTCHR